MLFYTSARNHVTRYPIYSVRISDGSVLEILSIFTEVFIYFRADVA